MSKWSIEQQLAAGQDWISAARQARLEEAYNSLQEEEVTDFTAQTQAIKALIGTEIFGCEFTKRDGSIRSGSFRLGVQKDLTGAGSAYDRDARGNITVWDMNKQGYRTIRLESIRRLSLHGMVVTVASNIEEE